VRHGTTCRDSGDLALGCVECVARARAAATLRVADQRCGAAASMVRRRQSLARGVAARGKACVSVTRA